MKVYLDGLVHPTARQDHLAFARHRAFIASRLTLGLAALSAFPLVLAVRGSPSTVESLALAWLITPIAIAFLLSRTGRFVLAHVMSALALAALVTGMALASGGLSAAVIVWLALIPAEAVLANHRRVVAFAGAIAVTALGVIAGAGFMGLATTANTLDAGAGAVVVLCALLYATGLALAAVGVARAGDTLQSYGERRYKLLAENMTDLITRHGRSGSVLFASPAAERIVGTTPASLMGHGLFDRVHVADRPAFLNALSLTASRGVETSVEFRLRHGGEMETGVTFVWVEMRCRPVADTVNHNAQVIAVLRDISERKANDAAIEAARAEADRANEARTHFLANVSHELRTPLNAINGFSEMLMHEEQLRLDPARRREYAGLIRTSGEHLLNLVNSILDMSKIESGHFEITPEPFALKPLVDQCADIMRLKVDEAGLSLSVEIGEDPAEIVGDKRAYRQILLNLLSNAIKFTKPGGFVTVTARRDGTNIVLTVADTGIGIASSDMSRLGSPFFQARQSYDRPYEGTGLGLSVVRGLAELHGGRLDVTSALGRGTRVSIVMPIDCEQATSVIACLDTRRQAQAMPQPPARTDREERKHA